MFSHANEIFNFHSLVAMASGKRVFLDLNTKVKIIKGSEKGKLSVKEIVTKFNVEKTEGYDTLKGKSELSDKIIAMVQSN